MKERLYIYVATADKTLPNGLASALLAVSEHVCRRGDAVPVAGTRPLSGLEPVKSKPVILSEITGGDEPRIDMHDEELNRVLGGGLVPARWSCWAENRESESPPSCYKLF